MTQEEIYEEFQFHGDGSHDDGFDMKQLCAEVISRLPEDVQRWLLFDTNHVFLCVSEPANGMIFHMSVPTPRTDPPKACQELRLIYLAENSPQKPREDVIYTIAHEIAHSWLGDIGLLNADKAHEIEQSADDQVTAWGFEVPKDRPETIKEYY